MSQLRDLTCEYGLAPYIRPDIEALNPCFISLVGTFEMISFILIGAIQFYKICSKREGPENFKYRSFWSIKELSRGHLIHLITVIIQCVLFLVQLNWAEHEPKWTRYNILLNILYLGLVYLPSSWLSYYKSSCALGHGLFYFILSAFMIGFQIVQRCLHWDTEDYNVIKGGSSALLVEILLFINGLLMLYYDAIWYRCSRQLYEYYEANDIYPPVNALANVTFTWMNRLITETYKANKIIDPSNMPLPPFDLNIMEASKLVEAKWEKERWTGRNSLLWTMLNAFGCTIFVAILYEVARDLLGIAQPLMLRQFIMTFDPNKNSSVPVLNGFFIAMGLFLINLFSTVLSNQFFINIFEAGLKIRGTLMSMIYQKALRLSPGAREEKSTGDILNMMSVDVLRIQRFFENAQILVGSPIQLVGILISLYTILGKTTIGGLVTLAIMFPVNGYISKSYKNAFKAQMKYKDKRIKTITEILNSMKSIKLYSWENPMIDRLNHVRNDLELENLKKIAIISNLIFFSWNVVPLVVTCSTFILFTRFTNEVLSPEVVFPALTLFDMLNECLYTVPTMINNTIEIGVSLKRLKEFLLSDELDSSFIEYCKPSGSEPIIELNNATFLWKSLKPAGQALGSDEEAEIASPGAALKNIKYFSAGARSLTCIVGKVGSGKSTFLQALLGQLPCVPADCLSSPPNLKIRATNIAYCPQQPWIMNGSLRENILFGHRYDEDFYNRTLRACQLIPDLEILTDGDLTLVGERGISLSGGQKARLSLARAVYARAELYLLDDILSAVDSNVCKNIIEQVLDRSRGLLKNKAVLLTTNAISVLKHSDMIYFLKDGEILESGSYSQAISQEDSPLGKLITEFANHEDENTEASSNQESVLEKISGDAELVTKDDDYPANPLQYPTGGESNKNPDTIDVVTFEGYQENPELERIVTRRASIATFKARPLVDVNANDGKPVIKAERKEEGRVKTSVYLAYLKACGLTGAILSFICMILVKLLGIAKSFWLKHWSEDNLSSGSNENVSMYVTVYAIIGIASSTTEILKNILLKFFCALKASKKLHNDMAYAVIMAPMSFFETTPIGRIVNRFSSDINAVDEEFQQIVSFLLRSALDYTLTVMLIGIYLPWFLVLNTVLLLIFYYYQRLYVVLSRELKRMLSISYSPVMSLMSETLIGYMVINAYHQVDRFNFYNFQNIQNNIDFIFNFRSTNRWLSMRLQSIGALAVLIASLLALLSLRTEHPMGPGMIGLLMSYALQLSSSLMWIIRMVVNVENSSVSVERILEYSRLKPEGVRVVEGVRPAKNWPERGDIRFVDYSTKYRDELDPVLKGINLEIKSTQKIGVVGRTGAGKSSLTMGLFRILEACEGKIYIDDIDISTIGLSDLRQNLSIIPQDSQAFEGTVKTNLDPFGLHTDKEIMKALELSHLKPHIERMAQELGDNDDKPSSLLEVKISENGDNLSMGQRQLLCLSRALLNPSKILVLDEATAAVDMITDKIIQETIRNEFKDRTIITIAHRIDTVLDSDKILVLDRGEVKEFDSPKNLLEDNRSMFFDLCEKGGYLKKKNRRNY